VEFLPKPFRDRLTRAVQQRFARDRTAREQLGAARRPAPPNRTLTPAERDVLALVVTGLLNKQIAAELGTSEAAVKVHRQHVMAKMGAGSLPHWSDGGSAWHPHPTGVSPLLKSSSPLTKSTSVFARGR